MICHQFLQVMRAWKASEQLKSLLKGVEADLREYEGQGGRRSESIYADTLPFLASQRQDWEGYASAGQSSATLVGSREEGWTMFIHLDKASAVREVYELWEEESMVGDGRDCGMYAVCVFGESLGKGIREQSMLSSFEK